MTFRLKSVFLCLLCGVVGMPQVADAQILNSERIEQTFGSYGIEVLYSDDRMRVSNLYSTHEGERITRTLAIVLFPESLAEPIRDLHARVLAGDSIGATFKAAGWSLIKRLHTYLDDVEASRLLQILMQSEGITSVAAHAYALRLSVDGKGFDYATIIEIHHPDYLNTSELHEIYSPWGQASPALEATLREQLQTGLNRLADAWPTP